MTLIIYGDYIVVTELCFFSHRTLYEDIMLLDNKSNKLKFNVAQEDQRKNSWNERLNFAAEFYYWDSYWIIEGLLLCDMYYTARGMIENLLSMVQRFGFVPNGGRVYYLSRSQPPLLIPMVCTREQRLCWYKVSANSETLSSNLSFKIYFPLITQVSFRSKSIISIRTISHFWNIT